MNSRWVIRAVVRNSASREAEFVWGDGRGKWEGRVELGRQQDGAMMVRGGREQGASVGNRGLGRE